MLRFCGLERGNREGVGGLGKTLEGSFPGGAGGGAAMKNVVIPGEPRMPIGFVRPKCLVVCRRNEEEIAWRAENPA